MKKPLIALLICFLFFLAFVYLFIPNQIIFNRFTNIQVTRQGLQRLLYDDSNWNKWWPPINSKPNRAGRNLYYNDFNYKTGIKTISSINVLITGKKFNAISSLHLLPVGSDSVKLVWQGVVPTSANPIKRLQIYWGAQQLKNDVDLLLKNAKSFFSNDKKIYGFEIRKEEVSDSILISTFDSSKGYPTVKLIYGLINELRIFASVQEAKQTGYPMLNIRTTDSTTFHTRVAIPINKRLKTAGKISYRYMMGGGKILVAEIKGGPKTVDLAFKQMENYMSDHQHTVPAIPFLSMVTDRSLQPDSTEWITRICYPVM